MAENKRKSVARCKRLRALWPGGGTSGVARAYTCARRSHDDGARSAASSTTHCSSSTCRASSACGYDARTTEGRSRSSRVMRDNTRRTKAARVFCGRVLDHSTFSGALALRDGPAAALSALRSASRASAVASGKRTSAAEERGSAAARLDEHCRLAHTRTPTVGSPHAAIM